MMPAGFLVSEAMDELQMFRMTVAWPLVVGGAMFQLAYTALWLAMGARRLRRDHAVACLVAGLAAAGLAWQIAANWDGSAAYWMAFTMGVAGLAGVLVLTAGLLFLRMWRTR